MKSLKNKSAFTLLELLVVIGLVAILAVLLFTGISSMHNRAKDTQCVANLRQLGQASLTFIAENNGQLFPSMFWYNTSTHPTDRGMRDYVGMIDFPPIDNRKPTVFTCPSLLDKFVLQDADRMQRTYSLNFYAHAVNVRKRNDPDPSIRNALQFPGVLLNIASPSKMWMLTDGQCLPPTAHFGTYITPDDSGISRTFSPHNGKQNAVFFDGHVAKMNMELFKNSSIPENKLEYDAFWGTLVK